MCPTPRCDGLERGPLEAAERTVRSVLRRLGYRFRRCAADPAGYPVLLLPRWRLAVFVVDCASHPHPDCTRPAAPPPAPAVSAEARRLQDADAAWARRGWQTLIVQACDADDPETLGLRVDIAVRGRLVAPAVPAGEASPGARLKG